MPVDPVRRPSRMILAAVFVAGLTACGTGGVDTGRVGASSSAPITGPTALTTRTLPSLAPRPSTEVNAAAVPSTSDSALQPLVDTITEALADPERVPPNVEVNQKAAAGNQLIVSWIVNTDPTDPQARLNARSDAVTIMTVVRDANLDHGSVLLNVTGSYLEEGKRKDTVVVRAKYTQPLVLATDWASVPPEIIFTLCDDKPAVIAPAFA